MSETNFDWNLIKLLLKVSSVAKLYLHLKCEPLKQILTYWISIVNQLTDWLADSLTDWSTYVLMSLKEREHSRHSRHLKGTSALWHSGHLGTRAFKGRLGPWALKVLGNLGTWGTQTLEWHLSTRHSRHLGTQALKGYLYTRALRHSGTWELETLKILYLATSRNW